MQSLKYLNTILSVIAILLTIQVWTSWTHNQTDPAMGTTSTAYAQGITSAAQQRIMILDELKKLNHEVSELHELFVVGDARVLVEGVANQHGQ